MFLGVTVFCVVLAVVVRRAEEQKKAVAALEAVQGVEIYYDYQWRFYFNSNPPFLEKLAPPGPDWLRELIEPYTHAVTTASWLLRRQIANRLCVGNFEKGEIWHYCCSLS